jgi:hypothetical protein
MKKYLLLFALVCLLGNGALAQDGVIMKPVTITIDFSKYGGSGNPGNNRLSFDNGHPRIDGQVVSERLTVGNTGNGVWNLYGSDTYNETYLQLQPNQGTQYATISDLKAGDVVTIWGECGNADGGDFNIYGSVEPRNTTYYEYQGKTYPNSKEYLINNSGSVQVQCNGQYSGIRKITIQTTERATNYFDYDPGYEEYDLYDEGKDDAHNTSYGVIGDAGFTLNGDNNQAKYIEFTNTGKTINNRIAIDPTAGTWRFKYGLLPPSTNGSWSNISICDLKEGDRVVFSYTGYDGEDFVRFSSVADPNGQYNGCKAFFDKYNDGIFNEGEDTYITSGAKPVEDWKRGDGTLIQVDHNTNDQNSNYLHYTQAIVITEDGHLDLAIKNAVGSRIVKIKIYSDHQAMMVDDYDQNSYVSKFDITGELQAKEHIVPGGLEVHVGSDDAAQHAHVIRSGNGPVSIVNGVDGFKLPGMSRNSDTGNLVFNFNLGKKNQQNQQYDTSSIPTTGTFYKFMPLENGKMTITFQAASMNYYRYDLNGDAVYYNDQGYYNHNNAWSVQFDRPNEQTVSGTCPYYLMKTTDGENFTLVAQKDVENGKYDSFVVDKASAEDNEIYYLFGGWNANNLSFTAPGSGNNNLEYFSYGNTTNGTKACGVAKLLEVRYDPEKKIYPLAKWVPNGTEAVKTGSGVPNPDTFETEYDLADLYGYNQKTSITVKKMSGNITACHPFIQKVQGENNHYKLMIDGITFANSKDQGGTILIKIGDATIKNNPVYTLTIAYSGNPTFDGNSGSGTRGHIWDYSSNSLHGLKYDASVVSQTGEQEGKKIYTHNAAVPEDYGHYFQNYFAADISGYSSADDVFTNLEKSGSGLLHDEIHAEGTHSRNSDWAFNYNLVNAGNLYDPLFMNKYDLEGDNADLIWETEGTVIKASANSSVMFNEFTGSDIHSSEKDPDRYVGILQGSEFRIPWLMPNDRVIIWMGTGKGAFNDHVVFNIRGAYDAVHNVISPTDEYIVGGSQWTIGGSYTGDGKNDYRGCYHFFATGHDGGPADMVFKMVGGNLCKIYKIQIYRGDRIITNDVVGVTFDEEGKPSGNHNNYLLWSRAADPNDNSGADKGPDYNWTLKYFGKDQKLADGNGTKGQKNEIVAQTGNINKTISTDAATNTFTYEHGTDEIGTFRMRGKDMEKNMNYVADYADHNVTVALQETQKYPYTWDFKDMVIYDNASFVAEDAIGPSKHDWFIPNTTDEDEIAAWDEAWNTSYEKSSEDLSLWVGKNGTYELRLNSQEDQTTSNPMEKDNIFQTATQNYDGNQLWAGGQVVPETKGLWFYTDNNNREAGQWKITNKGMALNGSTGWAHKMVVPNVPKNAAVYLRMVATKNANFTEQFKTDNENCEVFGITQVPSATDEWIFAILNKGEKQNLVLSFDGYRLLKLAVSEDPKTVNKKGYASESHKRVLDHSLTSFFTGKNIKAYLAKNYNESASTIDLVEIEKPMPAATENGDNVGSVLYNNDYYKDEDNVEHGQVDILDGGFHLFVPDMHDYTGDPNDFENMVTDDLEDTSGNLMLSYNAGATSNATIPQKIDGSIVYVLSYQYFEHDKDGLSVNDVNEAQVEAFYRVAKNGAGIKPNSAYITFPITTSQAKVSFLFGDELFGNQGITTGIDDAVEENKQDSKLEWYSLDGQKLNGVPTAKGLYIVNGKKVLVK